MNTYQALQVIIGLAVHLVDLLLPAGMENTDTRNGTDQEAAGNPLCNRAAGLG